MREMGRSLTETNMPDRVISAYNVVLSAEGQARRFESAMEETSQ